MLFEWANYDSVDYTNWARREPNNLGEGEDCCNIYYYVSVTSVRSRQTGYVTMTIEPSPARACFW